MFAFGPVALEQTRKTDMMTVRRVARENVLEGVGIVVCPSERCSLVVVVVRQMHQTICACRI